jgi:hypothetical protein
LATGLSVDYESDLTPYADPWDEAETAPGQAVGDSGLIQWQFHSEQARAFQSKARVRVIVAGRRWGKSVVFCRDTLAGVVDDNLKGTPGVSWVVMPTYVLARPLWEEFHRAAPPGLITHVSGTIAQPDFICVGDSRIEFKSADHPRRLVGTGLRRVVVDEAGLVDRVAYEESILPATMDYNAPIFLGGTPKGRGTWFHKLYAQGLDPSRDDVQTFGGPSGQNPFLKPGAIERMRETMPARLFRQEILANFLDDDGALFPEDKIRACIARSGGKLSTEKTTSLGIDLARLRDFTVLIGLDKARNVSYIHRMNRVDWPTQKAIIKGAYEKLGHPKVFIDASGLGDPIFQDLQRAGMTRLTPFKFTPQSKADLVDSLAVAVQQAEIGLPEEPIVLVNELQCFGKWTEKGGVKRFYYEAPSGLYDDCVIALALAAKASKAVSNIGISI